MNINIFSIAKRQNKIENKSTKNVEPLWETTYVVVRYLNQDILLLDWKEISRSISLAGVWRKYGPKTFAWAVSDEVSDRVSKNRLITVFCNVWHWKNIFPECRSSMNESWRTAIQKKRNLLRIREGILKDFFCGSNPIPTGCPNKLLALFILQFLGP